VFFAAATLSRERSHIIRSLTEGRVLTLYLVRHGQTDSSQIDRYSGELDVPLNDEGRAIAEALAARYAATPWAAIYASPKTRARETAAPLAKRAGVRVEIEPGLREIAYGAWDGKTQQEVEQRYPAEHAAWLRNPAFVSPPEGETGLEVAARATRALDAIRERHRDGNVLAVSHKATIRLLVCVLAGIDPNEYRRRLAQPVGGVTVFEFRETGPLLMRLADTSHIGPREARHS
jgi:probable phosphoglycerate mutase